MFWTEEKLTARIKDLEQYRYRGNRPIPVFLSQVDEEGNPGTRPPQLQAGQEVRVGDRWSGRDLYLWLGAKVEIPDEWKGQTVVGCFDFGITGGGNNSGFESLLYVNGTPYQGVDANHQEVFFGPEFIGTTVDLVFRLWSGLEGGGKPQPQHHLIRRAEMCVFDKQVDDFYYTSRAILETVQVLPENSPERILMLAALNRAFLKVDWSRPGSAAFYATAYAGCDVLHEEMDKIEWHSPVTINCVGHTHIDVAWLWRLKHTREKAARSFSTVLQLMKMFPEYIFLQTQPQLYDYIKTDYPELFQQIRERVKEGRWETDGAMWLEADCNLTSGESLVRQILMGTRFFRTEFGTECKYLWLPDVFGYSWALPQILKKSGIDTFMTTKISWNQYNRMPHDTFIWRGIDGSEVLAHFISSPEFNSPNVWQYTYNSQIRPATVKGTWDSYRDKAVSQNALMSFGYGDGGGGANREMLEMRRRLDNMPGLPNVKTSHASDFFKQLRHDVETTDEYVHTWDGELYLEYHRGTYTSQAYNKRMNRKLELLYRETEWLASLDSVLAGNFALYPSQSLYDGWKIILRNQFHDILPGSAIHEVYQDSRKEYASAHNIADDLWQQAAKDVAGRVSTNQYTVFNSAPWDRADLVTIPAQSSQSAGKWTDADGHELTAQRSDSAWTVAVKVPSLGFTTISFEETKTSFASPFVVRDNTMVTPFYEIAWNVNGQLERIYDKASARSVLRDKSRANVLQVFEDKPINFDAWDIDLFYQEKMHEVSDLRSVECVENGPLRATVQFVWQYQDSVIRQEMSVYADSRRIDFHTFVDWHEHQQLLKAAFPVEVRATEATYDIQFGNVKRPTHWNTSWDYARFESVGHQWADISEQGYGVSLLNDCKYGYDIKDSVLRLSLIKSAVHPDTEADQGQHEFTYALYPHQGSWLEGDTVHAAWMLNNPLTAVANQTPAKKALSLIHLSGASAMVDAVKKAEDANKLVVRVHDYSGGRGTLTMTSDLPVVSWQECNLMENPVGELSRQENLAFELKPYEIKTFLVEFRAN